MCLYHIVFLYVFVLLRRASKTGTNMENTTHGGPSATFFFARPTTHRLLCCEHTQARVGRRNSELRHNKSSPLQLFRRRIEEGKLELSFNRIAENGYIEEEGQLGKRGLTRLALVIHTHAMSYKSCWLICSQPYPNNAMNWLNVYASLSLTSFPYTAVVLYVIRTKPLELVFIAKAIFISVWFNVYVGCVPNEKFIE